MQTIRQQVREFMRAAEQPVRDTPQQPTEDEIRLRLRLITEEVLELLESFYVAHGSEKLSKIKEYIDALLASAPNALMDACEVADCLADTAYVVEGAAQTFGINSTRVGIEVHRANMAKFGPGSHRRADGKQMKPPGWRPPDIKKVLETQNDFQENSRDYYKCYQHYFRGFLVYVAPDLQAEPVRIFAEPPTAAPYRVLLDNIIDHLHYPVKRIEMHRDFIAVRYLHAIPLDLYWVET